MGFLSGCASGAVVVSEATPLNVHPINFQNASI